jgi:hypothetical protein
MQNVAVGGMIWLPICDPRSRPRPSRPLQKRRVYLFDASRRKGKSRSLLKRPRRPCPFDSDRRTTSFGGKRGLWPRLPSKRCGTRSEPPNTTATNWDGSRPDLRDFTDLELAPGLNESHSLVACSLKIKHVAGQSSMLLVAKSCRKW